MRNQERSILLSLGFDLMDGVQPWLRQAQLLREYMDRINDLSDRVRRLEHEAQNSVERVSATEIGHRT